MPKGQNPVIVVPGITGTGLRDEYPVSHETVWSQVLNKAYERIALHPDDIRYELRQPSRIRADATFPLIYEELIAELRYNLTEKNDEQVPVYAFPYDWRQPLAVSDALLDDFVDEVIDRTKLLRHYFKSDWVDDPKVDLVGHSMGGMIITGYLERRKKASRVGKVTTIATPYRGSCESVIKILTGTALLGPLQPASREREAARLTPALYHLIPGYSNAIFDADTNADISGFDVSAWQSGVIETLAEFIRLNGVDPSKGTAAREKEAADLLEKLLDEARAFHDRLEGFDLASAGLEPGDWMALVGVDAKTRIQLPVKRGKGKLTYKLDSDMMLNTWTPSARTTLTGDGTVPFFGAEPAFLERNNLVCLSPRDLSPFEVTDKVLTATVGWHATLPNVNLVHRLIVKHFKGKPGDSTVGGRAAPGILPEEWEPPIRGLRHKGD